MVFLETIRTKSNALFIRYSQDNFLLESFSSEKNPIYNVKLKEIKSNLKKLDRD